MFWGITIENGKRYTQVVDSSFHVSMAALEQCEALATKKPNVSLIIEHEKAEFLLCTLQHGKHLQQPLDLNFAEGEEVTFFLNGEGVVHLTGFLNGGDQEGFEDYDSDQDSDVNLNELEDEDDNESGTATKPSKNQKRKMDTKKLKEAKRKKIDSSEEEDDSDESSEDDSDDSDVEKFLQRQQTPPKTNPKLKQITPPGPQIEAKGKKQQTPQNIKNQTSFSSNNSVSATSSRKKKRNKKKKSDVAKAQNEAASPNTSSNISATPGKNVKANTAQKENNAKTPAKNASPKTPSKARQLPGGLTVEDLQVGSGPEAKAGKIVQVYYVGKIANREFDSVTGGKPFKFSLGKGEVIKGWDEGIKGMKVGGKRRVVIPPHQGYGGKTVGPIPPNSTLSFEITLKSVQ